jgi:thiol-disulfide isomerase/thioredoxin
MAQPRFTLLSRSYCHLCEDMLHALQRLHGEFSFTVDVVDVDADETLVAKYDELVPVLLGHRNGAEAVPDSQGDGIEICHYFLDEAKVRTFLAPA